MNDFTNILSQAKKMQDKMKEVQDNIKKIEVEGSSGGNSVKVVLNGNYEMKSIFMDENTKKENDQIKINPSLIQPSKEIKSIGEFDVLINLHTEVQTQIVIKTIPQEETK